MSANISGSLTQPLRQEDYYKSFVQNCSLKSETDGGPFDIYFFLEMEKIFM